MTRIKGIKVNGGICDLDLSRIGSVVHDTNGGLIGPDTELVEYINSHSGDTPSSGTTELTSADGTKFLLKVYDDGTLYADEQITTAITPKIPTTDTIADLAADVKKLYINSFYCGGLDADVHTLNYCSHNFVELCNLTSNDIKLDGISLLYLKGGTSAWEKYQLSGVIKKGSTFLIRGAQCSNIDGAKIVVDDYDLEFPNFKMSITESPSLYLRFTTETDPVQNPGWSGTFANVEKYFIDLVGVNGNPANSSAYMNKAYGYDKSTLNEVIFRRYYAMDGVSQGNKDLKAMNNSSEWCYVDLTKDDGDLIPSIEANAPKARIDGKNLYFDKSKLFENKPTVITCSFGIEAIDNGSGATRCFNWVSKGRHDEFIWIREKGTSDWGTGHESFKPGSTDEEYTRFGKLAQYYNRQHIEYADGVVFTAHKYIIHKLESGVYEYIAGRANRKGEPIINQCTDVREFTVRTFNQVKDGFKYVQTSDQQGFNWNEYRIWQAAGETIEREDRPDDPNIQHIQFMINTGDMTQNGSRMCEWIDYFNAKGKYLNNMEEMATVGNNDLSGKETYTIPGGGDATKLSPYNFDYFYTYEMDIENPPVFTVPVTGSTGMATYFIPSLYSFNYGNTHFMCLDSEIKAIAEGPIFGCGNAEGTTSGNFYPLIKEWCETDIAKNSKNWNIAFCHELPFHILTSGSTTDVYTCTLNDILDGNRGDKATGRGGASAGTNIAKYVEGEGTLRYWFSEFCQTHNIRLVMGGHKHTQTTSWPLLENVEYNGTVRSVHSYRPIIVLPRVKDYDPAADDELVEATVTLTKTGSDPISFTAKYPSTWTSSDDSGETYYVTAAYTGLAAFAEFKLESELPTGTKPVVYAMSQATSYKHTSNKELPAESGLTYLRYYYPATDNSTKANAGQKYPFYTIWTVDTASAVTGEVRKVVGAFGGPAGASDGIFDINIDGPYVLNGKCATDGEHNGPFYSINGLGKGISAESEEKVEILL